MRKKLVEWDLVECVIGIGKNLFYNSPMEATIVICRTNKPSNRRGKVMFIDARNEVTRKNTESYLEPEHIKKITDVYSDFREVEGFSSIVTIEEIRSADSKLSVQRYVRTGLPEVEEGNFDDSIADWMKAKITFRDAFSGVCDMIGGKVHV